MIKPDQTTPDATGARVPPDVADDIAAKALHAQRKRRNGYVLIFMALLLFAVGTYFRTSEPAHLKLLVQHGDNGAVFDQSVIFMLKHDPTGAYGVIVNRPDEKNPGYYYGGPVEPDKIAAFYTGITNFEGGVPVGDTGLYYIEGERAEELRKINPPPKWFIITRGYAGWGMRQLDREILRESWKVTSFSLPLVTETDPEFIWRAATEQATEEEAAAKKKITVEEYRKAVEESKKRGI